MSVLPLVALAAVGIGGVFWMAEDATLALLSGSGILAALLTTRWPIAAALWLIILVAYALTGGWLE